MLQNLLCLWKKKTDVLFFVFHLEHLSFSPYECPGLCWPRTLFFWRVTSRHLFTKQNLISEFRTLLALIWHWHACRWKSSFWCSHCDILTAWYILQYHNGEKNADYSLYSILSKQVVVLYRVQSSLSILLENYLCKCEDTYFVR